MSEYLTEERKEIIRDGMHLEICSGSIGHLNDKWLKEFFDCAGGKKRLTLAKLDCDIPSIEIVFPTYTDVEKCDELARTVSLCSLSLSPSLETIPRKDRRFDRWLNLCLLCGIRSLLRTSDAT